MKIKEEYKIYILYLVVLSLMLWYGLLTNDY